MMRLSPNETIRFGQFPRTRQRLHLQVGGMVQGIGFRPFVYTLAIALGLDGWVRNHASGAEIEIEGDPDQVTTFLNQLKRDLPAPGKITDLEAQRLVPTGNPGFEILPSPPGTVSNSAWILPDLATCPDCLREIFDPGDRRYHYPFTTCTHCGPRASILTALPYDRQHTTMQAFTMCPACQREYEDPCDRRFHAQPNACPHCGPQLSLWDSQGQVLSPEAAAAELIAQVADRIRAGDIVAMKGLGGFQLLVDAQNEAGVQRLRDRKHRPTKPLAVMYPTLEAICQDYCVSPAEAEYLAAAVAPIVLLQRQLTQPSPLAMAIAPRQATVGVMLPYTPLHHLLMAEVGSPIVATSGNRSGEPICIDEWDALAELGTIADVFLVHNRPIARPMDDSVVQMIANQPMILRRARGYALSPVEGLQKIASRRAYTLETQQPPLSQIGRGAGGEGLQDFAPSCLLAMGGHLKNAIALLYQGQILFSQHLGDLDTVQTVDRLHCTVTELLDLYKVQPVAIAHDAYLDYLSTQFAKTLSQRLQIPTIPIQHHYAHVLSGLVDRGLEPPVLGIAWDGTGYGTDGTLWGGEWLAVQDHHGFERIAHLRSFPLPGGDRAAREPRRAALGLLYEAFGDAAFTLDCPTIRAFQPQELKLLQQMLQTGVNSPRTSSMGRLFDAIASLTGLCHRSTFEGEAAMQLESSLIGSSMAASYPYFLDVSGAIIVDWQPMLASILNDGESVGVIAAQFHNTLVEMIRAIARRADLQQVVLTGGCFQNCYLLERAIQLLRKDGLVPHWHHQIPINDGGIAAGQLVGASWYLEMGVGQSRSDCPTPISKQTS
jgi:hydrogenase maturation protein HypF